MAHFRTMLSSENFSAADLWSEQSQKYGEIVVEIVKVSKGEVVGDKGRKKTMPMAQLRSAKNGQVIPKQLGLNATNCRTLASLAGSPNTEKWHGLWINLYVTKVDVGRETADAIRIRPELAKPPVQAGKQEARPANEPAFDPTDVQPEDRNG
jgi:hypothetical protein